MAEPTVDRDPVEFLAAEFMERLRQGQFPSVEEYATANPEWAEQIRELFPTIAAMEKLKVQKESLSGGRASLGPAKIERLGDLRIIREIGRGGMGIVYEAEQESLGRRVAVKVLPRQALLDDKHLRRFRREAKTAAKLHHTNIVPVLGVGEQDGFHYYVMQIIRGVGLDEIIPRLKWLAKARSAPSDSGSIEFDYHDERAANVSNVARAMVDGDLRSLVSRGDSSQHDSSPNGDGSSTGVHTSAPTESQRALPKPDTRPCSSGNFQAREDGPDQEYATRIEEPHIALCFGLGYWQSVARIGTQVAKALQYAHNQGTLHRDIKPANLLIDRSGTVWVADFGLAKAVEQDDVSHTGDIVGTLRYMAPEQFHGNSDARSDIYSLGLTLYELLTLKAAYNETDRKRSFLHQAGPHTPVRPRQLNPGMPRDLETIVLKAIADEPQARYQTAGDLAEDLERFLDDRPILARRASVIERLRRWRRRNPAIASLSFLAASLLVLVAIVSTVAYFRTEHARSLADQAWTAEQQQRKKAERTSDLAWSALDRIFERLSPHRYVSPDDFAAADENQGDTELEVRSAPVLSQGTAALLEEMLGFYNALAEQGDNDSQFRQRIAEAHRRVADIRRQLGQNEQAETAYREAIAVYQQLGEQALTEPTAAAEVASIYNDLGQVLRGMRAFDEARDAFDDAKQILEPLATASAPPVLRYELARTYYLQVARALGGSSVGGQSGNRRPPRRDGGRDREQVAKAIDLLDELTAEYDVPDYQHLLAMCYVEQYKQRRRGQLEEAKDAMLKAVALLQELVELYPGNADYRFTLGKVYVTDMYDFGVRSPEELSELTQRARMSLSLLDDLHREHPHVPEYLLSQAGIEHRLATLCLGQGDYEAAAAHYTQSKQLTHALEDAYPALSADIVRGIERRNTFFFTGALLGRLSAEDQDGRTAPEDSRETVQGLLEQVRDELLRVQQAAAVGESADDDRESMTMGVSYWFLEQVYSKLGDEEAATVARVKTKECLPDGRPPWGGLRGREESGPDRSDGGRLRGRPRRPEDPSS